MTIVTFINFDYNNGRYDSTVRLHLNKDSIVFNTRANAISWLEKHGFKSISKPDTDIWQRQLHLLKEVGAYEYSHEQNR